MIIMAQKTRRDIAPMMMIACGRFDARQLNSLMKRDKASAIMMVHKACKDTAAMLLMACRRVGAEQRHGHKCEERTDDDDAGTHYSGAHIMIT